MCAQRSPKLSNQHENFANVFVTALLMEAEKQEFLMKVDLAPEIRSR